MALSGSFYKYPVNPSYGSFGLYCEWSGEQSIDGNYTDVTLTVYVRYYNLSAGAKANSTVSINGTIDTYTSPAINNYPAKDTYHWIKSSTVRVYHNSDGTKTCTLSASWPFNGTYAGTSVGTITATKTVTLDPIARLSEPTVSATSVKMGSTVTIKTNRKSTALKHVLAYTFGTQTTEVQITTGVGDSYPWTVPDLAAKCNNALSGTCTIYCHTYSGSTYLGTKTTPLTLTVPGATTPTVSATTVKMGGSVTLGVSGRKSTNFKHYLLILLEVKKMLPSRKTLRALALGLLLTLRKSATMRRVAPVRLSATHTMVQSRLEMLYRKRSPYRSPMHRYRPYPPPRLRWEIR
ncbi:MAG: hypothetical protein IKK11_03860 [Oscillospiraceae bacterium]|nr:hypothetical protein [Oscillospiraceae bacterium]